MADASRWKALCESKPKDGRIGLACVEKDLYVGECCDALLFLIDSKVRELEKGEPAYEKMRYYTILKSLQQGNEKDGTGEKLRKDIEEAALDGAMQSFRSRMEKLGCEDVTTGGHLRFNFCSDPRYTMVFSSTPSVGQVVRTRHPARS